MGNKIKFDLNGNVEDLTIVLAKRSGEKLGVISASEIKVKDNLNAYSEISFRVHKYNNGSKVNLWDDIKDFKLIWVKEHDMWYEISADIDESDDTVKNINGISLSEAELSQIMLYGIEINTEDDIARDDYKDPTIFYNPTDASTSLLDRLMEKAPHYEIKHVDDSLCKEQRMFSFEDISIYDAFQEIAEEIGCIFIFDSGTNTDTGKIARGIYVYDLYTVCNNSECGYRGEFTDVCPECGGTDLKNAYGDDTGIFVSVDNLAETINYSVDKDAVKNCFKLEAGDDLMSATIRACNPNGTDYIWHFTDEMYADMSEGLVKKIQRYNSDFDYYQNEYEVELPSAANTYLTRYNYLVNRFKGNPWNNDDLENISTPIIGYAELMNVYYNTIDLVLYLESTMMPSIEMDDTTARDEAHKIEQKISYDYDSSSSVSVPSYDLIYDDNKGEFIETTISRAIINGAKLYLHPNYGIELTSYTLSRQSYVDEYVIWNCTFKITNLVDDNESPFNITFRVKVDTDYDNYLKYRVNAAIKDRSNDTLDLVTILSKSATASSSSSDYSNQFEEELDKYCLNSLNSIYEACQAVLNVIIEKGSGEDDEESDMSDEDGVYYKKYRSKLKLIASRIAEREKQIGWIAGKYDVEDNLTENGLQQYLEAARDEIQENLDFQSYIGNELWLEFCSYRREDKYSNTNYISDNLNNAELFSNARDFLTAATIELYKSSERQHTITSTLKNLLVMEEFKPLVDNFKLGNWIRAEIDGNVYKLRLIGYEIDYDSLKTINVEFSDVYRIFGGESDLKKILDQSKKMATSYGSTKHQAKQGAGSSKYVNDWVNKGLKLTNQKIVSGAENQEIAWDNNGLVAKEYIDITDGYSDKQVKLINKGLYFTKDNWDTVSAAIGDFVYLDPTDNFAEKEGYGVIADTLIGNLILGQEVGIYNNGGNFRITNTGLSLEHNSLGVYINTNPATYGGIFTIRNLVINPEDDTEVETKIFGVDTDGNGYFYGRLNAGNGAFTVDNSGNIRLNGDIAFGTDKTNIKTLYCRGDKTTTTVNGETSTSYAPYTKPTANQSYIDYGNTTINDWHKVYDSSHDRWKITGYKVVSTNTSGVETTSWVWSEPQEIQFLTYIDSMGIYTGTIVANHIYGGHISTNSFDLSGSYDTGYMDMYKQLILFNEPDSNGVKGDTKMAIGFLGGEQYNEPVIIMGSGDTQGNNIGYINKGASSLDMYYKGSENNLAYIHMKQDGTIYINGVEFTAAPDTDQNKIDLMAKANYWNAKLDGVKQTIGNRSVYTLKDDNSADSDISVTSMGQLLYLDGTSIKFNSNVVLEWSLIDNASSIENDISNANSMATSAQSVANTASSNVAKLANGTYTSGTFISGTEIASPRVSGGSIVSGTYYNSTEKAYFTIGVGGGSNYADFSIFRLNSSTPVYQIYDEGTSISFKKSGTEFMYTSGANTYPQGIWNFSNATVTGLSGSITPKFG